MIRLYEYAPRIDESGNSTESYRDFQNYLFSHPYTFLWDFPADKVVIYNVAYRISSLRRIPENNQVTCLCVCEGGGAGSGPGITKINTDVSLHGEGNEANPLGVQLSQLAGNRLQILDDGCFVGSEPVAYHPPAIVLSSSFPEGDYLKGEKLTEMILTVTVTTGSESITDLRIFCGEETLHVFEDLDTGSHTFTFDLPEGIESDTTFTASISDGKDYLSNTLAYRFILPIYCGVAKTMTLTEVEIFEETALKISENSFSHIYASFKRQHQWMCCPENRLINSIEDENGLIITPAFKKKTIELTIENEQYNYLLYVFDTKTTGNDYKLTFNF
jgi:hypothetical protein